MNFILIFDVGPVEPFWPTKNRQFFANLGILGFGGETRLTDFFCLEISKFQSVSAQITWNRYLELFDVCIQVSWSFERYFPSKHVSKVDSERGNWKQF